MNNDMLKNELRALAEAQLAFELSGWIHVDSIQKELYSNSTAYGTVYEKDSKKFYLNLNSANKALQLLKRGA